MLSTNSWKLLKKQIDSKGKQQGGSRQNSEFGEQFAKMVAQQEQIRRMMQQYADELKQSSAGQAGKELEDIMQKLEQTEHDLVNKTITEQTLMRQQQIMTRLLEHEKAQMQREKANRRQSTEAKEVQQLSAPDLKKYIKLKNKNIKTLQTNPTSFTDFYKNKVTEYFYNQWTIGKNNNKKVPKYSSALLCLKSLPHCQHDALSRAAANLHKVNPCRGHSETQHPHSPRLYVQATSRNIVNTHRFALRTAHNDI